MNRKKTEQGVISANVSVLFFKNKETGNIIADCPALGIVTYGKNFRIAQENFKEAFSLWIESVVERGVLKEALIELGWKVSKKRVILPKRTTFSHRDVPVELLASSNQYFDINQNLL